MGAACAAGMENGEKAAAKVELTQEGESSEACAQEAAAPVAPEGASGGSAASGRAGTQEAATEAAAQGAAGWSTLSRMVAVGGDAKVELGGWAADGTEWEDAAAAAAVVVVRN